MRVVKTIKKQLELAALGRLYAIVNCAYVRVSVEHVEAAKGHGVKFYSKN